jgi:peptidoglycan/LPS O-acetylase OafA/YrhL
MIYALATVDWKVEGPIAKAMEELGKASYAIYILQAPLSGLWFEFMGGGRPTLGLALEFSALLTVLCVFVYRHIEKPAERAIRLRYG